MEEKEFHKKNLRTKLLKQREQMSDSLVNELSEKISYHVLSSSIVASSKTIHCFISIKNKKEVNTLPLLKKLLESGITVVAPVTDFENNQLSHVKIENLSTLVPNKWGVPEPKNGQKIDVATLDLVLVPLLAIDNNGNRLGYGKGFYDRFLKKTTAQRIGLVFSNFVLDEVPSEPFDEQLDGYFTENGLRYLKQ